MASWTAEAESSVGMQVLVKQPIEAMHELTHGMEGSGQKKA